MHQPTDPGPDQLAELWERWRPELAPLAVTARPALLPHLRTIDQDQAVDIPFSLALSGYLVPVRAVASALGAAGCEAQLEGWPGAPAAPDPAPQTSRAGVEAGALAALDGWVAALMAGRIAILNLLQGAPPDTLLPVAVAAWHEALVRPAVAAGLVPAIRAAGPRLFHRDGAPAPQRIDACVARMWELAAAEPAWDLRALLLHLAVLWARPWPGANGRLARLLLNTLRAAGGHPWLSIPPAQADAYLQACTAACVRGDAAPFARLVRACTER